MSQGKDKFKHVNTDMVYAAITTLSASFNWKDSAEGHAYWQGIAERLEQIAAVSEAKKQTKH